MAIKVIRLDIAKSVFQVHGVDEAGQVGLRRRLRRAEVLKLFAGIEPALVGIEACASSHYWSRELTALGHTVRLMPLAYVKPYVKRQKNEAADAEAICEAVTRVNMRFVATKTPEQQSCLMLHRTRHLFIRQQTAVINAIRAHLAEFGIVAPGAAGEHLLNDALAGARTVIAFASSHTEHGGNLPLKVILSRPGTYAFALGKGLTDPIWWFYLFYLPKFLNDNYGLDLNHVKYPLITIYTVASIGSIAGGWLSGFRMKHGHSVNSGRKFALLVCALCVMPIMFVPHMHTLFPNNAWPAIGHVPLHQRLYRSRHRRSSRSSRRSHLHLDRLALLLAPSPAHLYARLVRIRHRAPHLPAPRPAPGSHAHRMIPSSTNIHRKAFSRTLDSAYLRDTLLHSRQGA